MMLITFTCMQTINTNKLNTTYTESVLLFICMNTMANWMSTCNSIHSTRVSPIFPSDFVKSESFRLINGDYEYLQSRMVFLNSYHFTRRNMSFKDLLNKLFKKICKMAMFISFGIGDELSKRKISIKVYKVTLVCPRLFIARCYMPCLYQYHYYRSPEKVSI